MTKPNFKDVKSCDNCSMRKWKEVPKETRKYNGQYGIKCIRHNYFITWEKDGDLELLVCDDWEE